MPITDDATAGAIVKNQRLVDLALNGRNSLKLVALSPNVTADFANGGRQVRARVESTGWSPQLPAALRVWYHNRREWNYFTPGGPISIAKLLDGPNKLFCENFNLQRYQEVR